jgi:large subunit ribosomal protein L21
MSYAVISVGGKQYLVHEGEKLLVDRLPEKEGATFKPQVLLASADGKPAASPDKVAVSARVVAHTLGEKIRIGKLKRRTGYRRHTGFRAKLSRIEIESIGAATQKAAAPARAAAAPKAVAAPKAAVAPKAEKAPAARPERAPAAKAEAAVPPPARAPARARTTKPKEEGAPAKPAAKAPVRKPVPKKETTGEAAPPKPARKPRAKKE